MQYLSNDQLAERLQTLVKANPTLIRCQQATQSLGGTPVWQVELGTGTEAARKTRPAMLLVAGIEGNDLAGSALALAWVEHLVQQQTTNVGIQRLLDTSTVYVFPRLNPDAAASFFKIPRVETATTGLPVDYDRDGLVDEDGPEDLDKDGLITWMRVQDPEGEYILDPADPRLLLKADRSKGERGAWKLFTEGIDNDHDEAWNEDGLGGVNLNRNFPFNYRPFAPWSGRHQVSEKETVMLADFVVEHPNIAIVFTYGLPDNLTQPPKASPKPGGRMPVTSMQEEDLPVFRELGKKWRECLGLKKELPTVSEPGTFSDWMYFHRGRLSLAARPWSPALQVALAGNSPKDKPKSEGEKPTEGKSTEEKTTPQKEKKEDTSTEDRNQEERAFIKWLDTNAPQAFVAWKKFTHPDFPDQTVEIGGFAPFARIAPPPQLLEELAARQLPFLDDLAGRLPRLAIRKATVKPLGQGVYEITVQVENAGYLPTSLEQGLTTKEVAPTRVEFPRDGITYLAGRWRMSLPVIPGSGGSAEARCVIRAKDLKTLNYSVISTLGGNVNGSVDLPESK